MANKYCNLDGTKKIKDEYKKINIGFDKVEEDLVNIIVTPAEGVSEQEIIQARKGKNTLNDRLNETVLFKKTQKACCVGIGVYTNRTVYERS